MSQSIGAKFWQECLEDAYASLYCPFVVGLAHGDLPQSSFVEYLNQDYFYLLVYEKAYFAAADMCDKLGNTKLAADFREWAKGSLHERELHEQRAKERNVEIKDMVPLKPTTDYTNLLTEAYEQKTLPDVTAAINPCGKLYGFIGEFIVKTCGDLPEHEYTEWAHVYAGEETQMLINALNDALDSFEIKDMESARHYYYEAMRLEYEFFNQQSGVPPLWTTQYIKNIYLTHNGIYKENDKKYDGVDRFLELGKDYSLNITIDQVEKKEQQSVDSVVVCGPSVEDLEAQLDSKNILLWVQPSAEAQEAMKKKGYTLLSLYRLVGGKKPESLDSKTIYIVENWYEIGFAFIGGHYYTKASH